MATTIRGAVFKENGMWCVKIMRLDAAGEVIDVLQRVRYCGPGAWEWAREHADVGVGVERLRATLGSH